MTLQRRVDIQVMRGFAVMLVIIYHSDLGFFPGGYLGVDIFFVLSGFLITQLVLRDIEQGNFSLSNFYARRARRLFPSLFAVVAIVALLGPKFLDAASVADLPAQILGGVTYTANFVMAAGGGYFELASSQKPLLHLWSLAVEEQYYLVAPLIFMLTPKRYLAMLVALIAVFSATLCFLPWVDDIDRFYMLPTRAWQLGLGSLAALACPRKLKAISEPLAIPAVIGLLLLAVFPFQGASPNVGAVLACVATVVIIGAKSSWLCCRVLHLSLSKIGDFSYSLYLVHWPMFGFFRQVWIGDAPAATLVLLTALTLPVGYLLFRFVEQPINHMEVSEKSVLYWSAGATGILVALGVNVLLTAPPAPESWKPNVGLGMSCEFRESFSPSPECLTSPQPSLLVWGDSFAMHLVPGLQATTEAGFAQATKSVCGPTVGAAPFEQETTYGYGREWAKDCLSFNESVLRYLASTPSIETVILASSMRQYVSQEGYRLMKIDRQGVIEESNISVTSASTAFGVTVDAIRNLGRKVVIVAPPPSAGFASNLCIDRRNRGKILLGPMADCSIPIVIYQGNEKEIFETMSQIKENFDVSIISFDDFLCGKESCMTEVDGVALYNDAYHLSVQGSEIAARLIDLSTMIDRYAR